MIVDFQECEFKSWQENVELGSYHNIYNINVFFST